MSEEKKYYDCMSCVDKNCSICPACGRNPAMRDITDSYRQKSTRGYYSSSIIPRYDADGNFIGYAYNKNGE